MRGCGMGWGGIAEVADDVRVSGVEVEVGGRGGYYGFCGGVGVLWAWYF